jgi:hypothetical protein
MDSGAFDQFARLVGSDRSRRAILKAVAGGTFAAAAARMTSGTASAHRARAVGNACAVNSDCASNWCLADSDDRGRKLCACVSPADCPLPTDLCQNGACRPQICFTAPACSIDTDCGSGRICRNGVCFQTCNDTPDCCTGCASCLCEPSKSRDFVCLDTGTFIGTCVVDSDCPPGSLCGVEVNGENQHLCERACPCQQQ